MELSLGFYLDLNDNLRERVSSDMEIYQVSTCGLEVRLIREADISLLEIYPKLLTNPRSYLMLSESTKYLSSLTFEYKLEYLSFELRLYLECLEESHTSLIFCFLLIIFDFFESFCGDLSCESLGDDGVASLPR